MLAAASYVFSAQKITHRDDVATQAVGSICTFNHGAKLGVPHPCLFAGGAHRACRGRVGDDS